MLCAMNLRDPRFQFSLYMLAILKNSCVRLQEGPPHDCQQWCCYAWYQIRRKGTKVNAPHS